MMIHFWRCKRLQLVLVCIEPKIQILVWIYYGCLESTKELLRLPLTTTGRAERSRKKGNPNSWGTLVRGLKTNLPSSSTVENLHSYSLKPVMILSNSRNALTSRLLHNICIDLVFYIGLLFLRELWSLWIDFGLIYHSWDRYRFYNQPTFRSFDFYSERRKLCKNLVGQVPPPCLHAFQRPWIRHRTRSRRRTGEGWLTRRQWWWWLFQYWPVLGQARPAGQTGHAKAG